MRAGAYVAPFEIARCLRRDLGYKAGIAYARKIERSGGAMSTDYGEAADILERDSPALKETGRNTRMKG